MNNKMRKMALFFMNDEVAEFNQEFDTQINFFVDMSEITNYPDDIPFDDIVKFHKNLEKIISDYDLTEGNFEPKIVTENWYEENGKLMVRIFDKESFHCQK